MAKKEKYYDCLKKNAEKELAKQEERRKHLIFKEEEFNKSLDWNKIKEFSSNASNENAKSLLFFFIPHKRIICFPKILLKNTKITINLMTKTTDNLVYFFDNPPQPNQKIIQELPFEVYEYIAVVDNRTINLFIESQLDTAKSYYVDAIEIPKCSTKKSAHSSIGVIDYFYLARSPQEIKLNFEPLKKIIPNIKRWQDLSLVYNFERERPMHSQDTNSIINIGSFWAKKGVIGTNLILYGDTGSKKTPYIEILMYMTKDEWYRGQSGTLKGLLLSFYNDNIKKGAMLEAKEIVLIDEFLRCFINEGNHLTAIGQIRYGLDKIMPYLDRKTFVTPSGKYDYLTEFNKPFIATDNLGYKEELQSIFKKDQALLKRYCFLSTNELIEENQRIQIPDDETQNLAVKRFTNIYGKNPYPKMELLRKFMQSKIGKVTFEQHKVNEICNRLFDLIQHKFQISQWSLPLIEGIIILRTIIQHTQNSLPTRFIAIDDDYVELERLMMRLCHDNWEILIDEPNPIKIL